jgi:DNA-binding winged helix-turn-helix (wHTH) protein/pimeloyl-ACP methyl ester carboxylesterase
MERSGMPLVFSNCELDVERRELRAAGAACHVEPQVFDVLVHLIRHRSRVVSKEELIDAVWGRRVISDATLSSRISAARRAIGDDGDQQRLIRTVARKGFRFVGEIREPAAAHPARAEQAVRFCRTADGVHLAMAAVGSGPALLKTANWLNHVEYDWRSPVWSPLFTLLAAQCRLVRYDERGSGLSDWDVDHFSFEAFVEDLETVVAAEGLERFSLLGISQGVAVAIAYAVRHPERVSRLILCGGFAKGWRKRGSASEVTRAQASIDLIREGWGHDNPAARQMFTSLIVPEATLEEMRWLNDLERVSASPENAIRLLEAIGQIDVTDLLARVAAPTLVLHSRGDARVPFEHGLALARAIRGCRFVPLESKNHLVLSHEPAWPRFTAEISAFLKEAAG